MIFNKKVGHSPTTWRGIYPELIIVGKLASGISVEMIHGYPRTFVSVWLYSIRTIILLARKHRQRTHLFAAPLHLRLWGRISCQTR